MILGKNLAPSYVTPQPGAPQTSHDLSNSQNLLQIRSPATYAL